MKKILFTIFATAALLGCSEGDTITPATPRAISFGNVKTRVDSASDIKEFSVWATVSSRNSDGSVNPEVSYVPILTNERVYRNPADSNNWTYDNTQNWISNSYFHFFAAHPYNVGFQQIHQEANGQFFTGYYLDVTADGSADTQDILVATIVKDTTDESFSEEAPVSINFVHLLTKVNVKIRQNFDISPDFNYYVTKVTLTGLKGNGSYYVLPYDTSFAKSMNLDNAKDIVIEKIYDEPRILRNIGAEDPAVVLSVWEDGLMLIPQDIATNGVRIRIDYLYDVNLDDDDKGTPKFIEGYIPPTKWESSMSINYSVAIADTSYITFDKPTIEPWGSPQTGGTIIIK